MFVAWQLHVRARAARPSIGAGACVDFYRRALARQRDALATVARWYIAPMVPGMLLYVAGRTEPTVRGAAGAAITLAIAAVVLAIVLALNRRAARRLQAEIDVLPHA